MTKVKRKVNSVMIEVLAFLLSLIFLVPLYYVFINSFKGLTGASEGTLAFPTSFEFFNNVVELMNRVDLLNALKNTVIYTSLSVVVIVLTSSSVAFILQRRNNKFTNILSNICLMSIIVPFFAAPTFFLVNELNLLQSVFGPVFVYSALSFSLSVFLLTGYYKSIPREIDEAAIMDGCGIFRLFFQVIMPLSKPMIITVIIIQTINIWNDFGVAVYFMTSAKRQTLVMSTYLFYSSQDNLTSWNLIFTNLMLTSLPIIIVYLCLQKHIIAGMTAGSVKG